MSHEAVKLPAGLSIEMLPEEAAMKLQELFQAVRLGGCSWLEAHLSSLPRKLGRAQPFVDLHRWPGGLVDLARYRVPDLAAAALLLEAGLGQPPDEVFLQRLYFQGDAEERRMLLRALPFLPRSQADVPLLEEAHRTNDETIFCAGCLDSDLPARVLEPPAYERIVLKAAFLELPLERLLGVERRATKELSRMLLDFRSERQAAGRSLWAGTLPLLAAAPCPGSLEVIAGDLWHGDDRRRLAAARAALVLVSKGSREPFLHAALLERLPLELEESVQGLIKQAVEGSCSD